MMVVLYRPGDIVIWKQIGSDKYFPWVGGGVEGGKMWVVSEFDLLNVSRVVGVLCC